MQAVMRDGTQSFRDNMSDEETADELCRLADNIERVERVVVTRNRHERRRIAAEAKARGSNYTPPSKRHRKKK